MGLAHWKAFFGLHRLHEAVAVQVGTGEDGPIPLGGDLKPEIFGPKNKQNGHSWGSDFGFKTSKNGIFLASWSMIYIDLLFLYHKNLDQLEVWLPKIVALTWRNLCQWTNRVYNNM